MTHLSSSISCCATFPTSLATMWFSFSARHLLINVISIRINNKRHDNSCHCIVVWYWGTYIERWWGCWRVCLLWWWFGAWACVSFLMGRVGFCYGSAIRFGGGNARLNISTHFIYHISMLTIHQWETALSGLSCLISCGRRVPSYDAALSFGDALLWKKPLA